MPNIRYIVSSVSEENLENSVFEAISEAAAGGDELFVRYLYDGHNLIAIIEGEEEFVKRCYDIISAHTALRSPRILHKLEVASLSLEESAVNRLDASSSDTIDQSYLGHLIRSVSHDDKVSLDTLMAILNRFLINNQPS